MVMLTVVATDDPHNVKARTADFSAAQRILRDQSTTLRQWPVAALDVAAATQQEVLDAYAAQVNELCKAEGFSVVDCIKLHPLDNPDWHGVAAKSRDAFRAEHRHSEDEVRFFASGKSCFYLRDDTNVIAVICEAGELLSVPAGVRHWFDMGPVPDFCAIRFFERPDGWIADWTGDELAQHVPPLPQLVTHFEAGQ